MTLRPLQFLIIAAAGLCFSVDATESEPKSATGIERIQLATNGKSISPGEEITVALVMVPAPGYHIYWRGPGIVGVAPVISPFWESAKLLVDSDPDIYRFVAGVAVLYCFFHQFAKNIWHA